ncbi:MAG: hypothetical protein NC347_01970 [Clostridium sp.]|nr:hypothetical protein [Clostridium sp.]
MGIEEEIFELYVRDYRIETLCYHMMGRLLDIEWVKERLLLYDIESLYIYGGGYLGVQLYNAVHDMVNVKAIVDKNGGLSVNVKGIHTISLDDLMREYTGEKIIITPVKYYQRIQDDLSKFADKKELLFLGEFLEGMVQQ